MYTKNVKNLNVEDKICDFNLCIVNFTHICKKIIFV